jgi:hypothetical protein
MQRYLYLDGIIVHFVLGAAVVADCSDVNVQYLGPGESSGEGNVRVNALRARWQ